MHGEDWLHTDVLGQRASVDLVERNNRHALAKFAICEKIFANLLVLDDDVIQSTTSGNFQGSGFVVVFAVQRNQARHKALHL